MSRRRRAHELVLQRMVENEIREGRWTGLDQAFSELHPGDAAVILNRIDEGDAVRVLDRIPEDRLTRIFPRLTTARQRAGATSMPDDRRRRLVSQLRGDQRTRLLEAVGPELGRTLLGELTEGSRRHVESALESPAQSAGRMLDPHFLHVDADATVSQAQSQIESQLPTQEHMDDVFVVRSDGVLVAQVRLGRIVQSDANRPIADVHDRDLVSLHPQDDREDILRAFRKYRRPVLPVVDDGGRILGVVSFDDAMALAEQSAGRRLERMGGAAASDGPYLQGGLLHQLKKRGGWLSALFLSEMLTASAMGYFQNEISKAVVLALFVPLIISSGGNSGSQASTLVVRAIALQEVHLADWWRILRRELASGVILGFWLGALGFLRITIWQHAGFVDYGGHYLWIGLTIWVALIGVVTFGSTAGSLLPLILRKLGFDPAVSSSPFIATLVDVTGLIIYFTVARWILRGILL